MKFKKLSLSNHTNKYTNIVNLLYALVQYSQKNILKFCEIGYLFFFFKFNCLYNITTQSLMFFF